MVSLPVVRAPLDGAAVRDTIAAVFRGPAFSDRSWMELLWLRLADLYRAFTALVRTSHATSAVTFWIAVVLTAAVVAAVVARAAMRREQVGRRRGAAVTAGGDAWADAEAAAGAGRYDEAAHRLYGAVVTALARAGHVRPHASKTPGDYVRELRRGGAGRADVARTFAPFARGYQAVVYGPRAVDAARYDALRAAALPLVAPGGVRTLGAPVAPGARRAA